MINETAQQTREQGNTMTETFQIYPYRNSDNLHLRLMGVFDEEAALSLMEVLNENRTGVGKIFVHTAPLDQVRDSGVEMFRSKLGSLDRPGAEIIFTGKAGERIAGDATGLRSVK